MSDRWNPVNDEIVEWISGAGSSLQVSGDLRHRVLDGAQKQLREEHAWQKAFFVCLLVTLLATAVGWWANRLSAVQIATTAAPRWSTELSRIEGADDATRHEVLSWSGWTLRQPEDPADSFHRESQEIAP